MNNISKISASGERHNMMKPPPTIGLKKGDFLMVTR